MNLKKITALALGAVMAVSMAVPTFAADEVETVTDGKLTVATSPDFAPYEFYSIDEDILSNYQGYRKCTLILVFDAYKVEGHVEEVLTYHNIYVVYTREAETADQYIEKTVHKIGRQYQVTVATSDGLEQVIIMGQGAHRISAQGLKKEIEDTERNARAQWHEQRQSSKTYLFEHMPEEFQAQMEKIRLGEAGEE